MSFNCPKCNKPIKLSDGKSHKDIPYFPFCSQRCRLIDLGKWIDGDYVIKTLLANIQNEEKKS